MNDSPQLLQAPDSSATDLTEVLPLTGSSTVSDDITKAPFFGDPVFQQFYARAQSDHGVVENLFRVLDAGRYSITKPEMLRDVLEDAFLLYDIAVGKRKLSELLGAIERRATGVVFGSLLVDLQRFLAPRLSELTLAMPPDSEKVQ